MASAGAGRMEQNIAPDFYKDNMKSVKFASAPKKLFHGVLVF